LVEKVYRKWLEKEDPNFTEIGREGGEKVAEERDLNSTSKLVGRRRK
jgi:hypothetical protein